MKIPCAAIRDLLPLYAEKMVEPETRQFVEEHLADCPECREKLSGIETGNGKPVDTAAPLQTLKKEVRRRRWFAVLMAALGVFVLVFSWMYQRSSFQMAVSWQEGLAEVKGVETAAHSTLFYYSLPRVAKGDNGTEPLPEEEIEEEMEGLTLLIDSSIAGAEAQVVTEEDGSTTAFVQGFTRRFDFAELTGVYNEMHFYPVPDRVIYGYSEPQKLLWGEPLSGGAEVLPRLTLAYYVLIAVGLAAVLGILWFAFRGRDFSWMLRQAFFAPVSYLMAHILIKGMQMTSFLIERDLGAILLAALALYGLLTLGGQAWLRRRKEQPGS